MIPVVVISFLVAILSLAIITILIVKRKKFSNMQTYMFSIFSLAFVFMASGAFGLCCSFFVK